MAEESKPTLPLFELTERVLGVFFSVYNELGAGSRNSSAVGRLSLAG